MSSGQQVEDARRRWRLLQSFVRLSVLTDSLARKRMPFGIVEKRCMLRTYLIMPLRITDQDVCRAYKSMMSCSESKWIMIRSFFKSVGRAFPVLSKHCSDAEKACDESTNAHRGRALCKCHKIIALLIFSRYFEVWVTG